MAAAHTVPRIADLGNGFKAEIHESDPRVTEARRIREQRRYEIAGDVLAGFAASGCTSIHYAEVAVK